MLRYCYFLNCWKLKYFSTLLGNYLLPPSPEAQSNWNASYMLLKKTVIHLCLATWEFILWTHYANLLYKKKFLINYKNHTLDLCFLYWWLFCCWCYGSHLFMMWLWHLFIAAFDGEIHSIQLPPVNSASFVLRFLENLCHSLQCDNLLSSQPFSSYRGNTHSPEENDQNKPGKRKCKILY